MHERVGLKDARFAMHKVVDETACDQDITYGS